MDNLQRGGELMKYVLLTVLVLSLYFSGSSSKYNSSDRGYTKTRVGNYDYYNYKDGSSGTGVRIGDYYYYNEY